MGLSIQTLPPPESANPRRWIVVINPTAGKFKEPQEAARLGEDIRKVAAAKGLDVYIYETPKEKEKRTEGLRRLLNSMAPTTADTLGVFALGGDGTLNDMILGVMSYLFPDLNQYTEDAGGAAERMLVSGIFMGTAAMGGANDLSVLYKAPRAVPERLIRFMQSGSTVPLVLGTGFLDGGPPVLFAHSLSGGVAIAPVYEQTVEERGLQARRHRQKLGFQNVVIRPQSIGVSWGEGREETAFEVIVHATRRADGMNGFPGAPFPGLGVKIMPNWGRWNTFMTFDEIAFRGLVSRLGWTGLLTREKGLRGLPPSHQRALEVGEEMAFFFDEPVAVQACGDHVQRATQMRAKATAPFPRFLSHPRSTMAQIAHRFGRTQLAGPGLPRLFR